MPDCLFCQIVAGDIPANEVYRDERVVAFHDINPQAPVHVLVIPASHHANVGELAEADPALLADVFATATSLTGELGLNSGYRVVVNTGADGGQTVDHMHVHLFGGRHLAWPPG